MLCRLCCSLYVQKVETAPLKWELSTVGAKLYLNETRFNYLLC